MGDPFDKLRAGKPIRHITWEEALWMQERREVEQRGYGKAKGKSKKEKILSLILYPLSFLRRR